MSNVVFWFRRDLRLADNPALRRAIDIAISGSASVIPLFIVDERLTAPSGSNRLVFLDHALQSLVNDGVPLVRRVGSPMDVFPTLVADHDVRHVVFSADFGPYGTIRDESIMANLNSLGVATHIVDSPYVNVPGSVNKADGTPYRVFTPYSKVWLAQTGSCVPARTIDPRKVPWAKVDSESWSTGAPLSLCLPEPSERGANQRLREFVASGDVDRYDDARDNPAADATSRLSAYLKFGLLHPRQVLAAVRASPGPTNSPGRRTFVSEICWREFYADVLFRQPESARNELNASLVNIEFDSGDEANEKFEAWKNGRTGFPFVDAGMRQLQTQGWMHNRVRMVVASFLVKDLHLDWRWGARWFMNQLVDGDLASNQHGWQWTAGTGTDAAPYFRVFNPVSQGKKFDPKGDYVRRFVPELAHLGVKFIHEPWLSAKFGEFGSETPLGRSPKYPERIVDHANERAIALARYGAAKLGLPN
jgi:deoxyribodipyrimidine photo-lyase